MMYERATTGTSMGIRVTSNDVVAGETNSPLMSPISPHHPPRRHSVVGLVPWLHHCLSPSFRAFGATFLGQAC